MLRVIVGVLSNLLIDEQRIEDIPQQNRVGVKQHHMERKNDIHGLDICYARQSACPFSKDAKIATADLKGVCASYLPESTHLGLQVYEESD